MPTQDTSRAFLLLGRMQHWLHLEFLPDRPAVPPSVHFRFELFQTDGHVTTVAVIMVSSHWPPLWCFRLNVSNDLLHNENMFTRFTSVDHMHALYISHNININIRDTTSPHKLLQKLTSKSTKAEIKNSEGLIKCSKESSGSLIFF